MVIQTVWITHPALWDVTVPQWEVIKSSESEELFTLGETLSASCPADMIPMLGTGKEFGCLQFLVFSDPLVALVLPQKVWDQNWVSCRLVGLVGGGEDKLHSYSKGKGKMTDESLIGFVLSVLLPAKTSYRHWDLGSHLNRATISSSVIPPSMTVKWKPAQVIA